jgi:hypothetical protein
MLGVGLGKGFAGRKIMVHSGFPEFHIFYKIILGKIFDEPIARFRERGDSIGDVNTGVLLAAVLGESGVMRAKTVSQAASSLLVISQMVSSPALLEVNTHPFSAKPESEKIR